MTVPSRFPSGQILTAEQSLEDASIDSDGRIGTIRHTRMANSDGAVRRRRNRLCLLRLQMHCFLAEFVA